MVDRTTRLLALILALGPLAGQGGQRPGLSRKRRFPHLPGHPRHGRVVPILYAPDPQLEMTALLKRVKKPALVVVAGADQIVRDLDKLIAPLVDGKRL